MKWGRFFLLFRHLFFETLIKKLNMLAFVVMLALALNAYSSSPLESFTGLVLFCIFYSSVYFYNDLYDLERDKTRPLPHKLLARGIFSRTEYRNFWVASMLLGFVLCTLFSPVFSFLALFAVLANFLRTKYLSSLPARTVSLFFVEFANLLTFWYAATKTLIYLPSLPPLSLYACVYIFAYALYKKGLSLSGIHAVFLPFIFLSLYFSLPVFLSSGIALFLLAAFLLHIFTLKIFSPLGFSKVVYLQLLTLFVSSIIFLSYPLFLPEAQNLLALKEYGEKGFVMEYFYEKPSEILESSQSFFYKINNTAREVDLYWKKNLKSLVEKNYLLHSFTDAPVV